MYVHSINNRFNLLLLLLLLRWDTFPFRLSACSIPQYPLAAGEDGIGGRSLRRIWGPGTARVGGAQPSRVPGSWFTWLISYGGCTVCCNTAHLIPSSSTMKVSVSSYFAL